MKLWSCDPDSLVAFCAASKWAGSWVINGLVNGMETGGQGSSKALKEEEKKAAKAEQGYMNWEDYKTAKTSHKIVDSVRR